MIRWLAHNDFAANFLLLGILLFGRYSLMKHIPLEVQPSWNEQHVNIEAPRRLGQRLRYPHLLRSRQQDHSS